MPWTGSSFKKHNKGLSSSQSARAAKIANAVLKSSGDEAKAIKIANATIRRVNSSSSKRGGKRG